MFRVPKRLSLSGRAVCRRALTDNAGKDDANCHILVGKRESVLDGELGQRRQIVDPELVHQATSVRDDGPPGDEEDFRDLSR